MEHAAHCLSVASLLIALTSAIYAVRRWGRIGLLLVVYLAIMSGWGIVGFSDLVDWNRTVLLRVTTFLVANSCLLIFIRRISNGNCVIFEEKRDLLRPL
jgi:hypothetical protein